MSAHSVATTSATSESLTLTRFAHLIDRDCGVEADSVLAPFNQGEIEKLRGVGPPTYIVRTTRPVPVTGHEERVSSAVTSAS